jgi:hypothetical protein
MKKFLQKNLVQFLTLFGLLMSVYGGWVASRAVIISPQQADEVSGTVWRQNAALKRSLVDQSNSASRGLILIVFGSALQAIGIVASFKR